MRNVYIVSQYQAVHNEINFILNEKKQLSQLQPVGQVIVDSDNEAFLYIIEENDAYSYIGFPQAVWSQLVQMLKSGQQPYLKVEDGLVPLIQFTDELKGLLYNIVGNSNYGDRFVEAVEKEFADFL
ncbi:hypothetical protein H9635_02805 [Solibacillus sp. A46]|uniref:Uncharacterized protein n=1 Tax=Solibacillus faecavium TaxID=2762221 RepID=A0ABR8XUP0_9BACL|nr:hypothetical protein [Solibacillus faecavium]MBD8035654.1 hypothetical protein [Solibacillus faecavium]